MICQGLDNGPAEKVGTVRQLNLSEKHDRRAKGEPWVLEALPGIGEVLAQRIVDCCTENGPLRRIEDLLKVSGIGQGTLEKIKDYITMSD